MVTFEDIERPTVDLDILNNRGNQDVWIGVSISVRIRRKIVGNAVVAYRDVLRDRLSMISSYPGQEILGCFDPAGGGLDRQAWNGDRSSRSPGVGVQEFLPNEDVFAGIRRADRN